MRHLRAAIKNIARAYGGYEVLASVMGVQVHTLAAVICKNGRQTSGTLAIRLAQAAGISVEALLTGQLNAAGRCPTCGHRAGDGHVVAAGGGR